MGKELIKLGLENLTEALERSNAIPGGTVMENKEKVRIFTEIATAQALFSIAISLESLIGGNDKTLVESKIASILKTTQSEEEAEEESAKAKAAKAEAEAAEADEAEADEADEADEAPPFFTIEDNMLSFNYCVEDENEEDVTVYIEKIANETYSKDEIEVDSEESEPIVKLGIPYIRTVIAAFTNNTHDDLEWFSQHNLVAFKEFLESAVTSLTEDEKSNYAIFLSDNK